MRKQKTLYEIIGELRQHSHACRFLNKQKIIDCGVHHFRKLLVYREVIQVCEILLEQFNDAYDLEENLYTAIYDHLNH